MYVCMYVCMYIYVQKFLKLYSACQYLSTHGKITIQCTHVVKW